MLLSAARAERRRRGHPPSEKRFFAKDLAAPPPWTLPLGTLFITAAGYNRRVLEAENPKFPSEDLPWTGHLPESVSSSVKMSVTTHVHAAVRGARSDEGARETLVCNPAGYASWFLVTALSVRSLSGPYTEAGEPEFQSSCPREPEHRSGA